MSARDEIAFPKTENLRIPKLLALARDATCMLTTRVKHHHDQEAVVAAHSDQARHGKGLGIKAHDCFVAFICHNCHALLPTIKRDERDELFGHAMTSTRNYLCAMRYIVGGSLNNTSLIMGITISDMNNDANWLEGWRSGRIQVRK